MPRGGGESNDCQRSVNRSKQPDSYRALPILIRISCFFRGPDRCYRNSPTTLRSSRIKRPPSANFRPATPHHPTFTPSGFSITIFSRAPAKGQLPLHRLPTRGNHGINQNLLQTRPKSQEPSKAIPGRHRNAAGNNGYPPAPSCPGASDSCSRSDTEPTACALHVQTDHTATCTHHIIEQLPPPRRDRRPRQNPCGPMIIRSPVFADARRQIPISQPPKLRNRRRTDGWMKKPPSPRALQLLQPIHQLVPLFARHNPCDDGEAVGRRIDPSLPIRVGR